MQSTPKPSDATFGQAPTFNSDAGFVLDVSDDKKALYSHIQWARDQP
jgi:hypothetical protein